MNKYTKQQLENDFWIMRFLIRGKNTDRLMLGEMLKQTKELLAPKQQDEECSDGLPKQFAFSSLNEDNKK